MLKQELSENEWMDVSQTYEHGVFIKNDYIFYSWNLKSLEEKKNTVLSAGNEMQLKTSLFRVVNF